MLVAAIVAVLNAVLPPIVAALRLPFTVALGFLLVLALDAADAADRGGHRARGAGRRGSVRCAARRDRRLRGRDGDRGRRGRQRRRRVHAARRPARGPAQRSRSSRPTRRGSCSSRSTGCRCRCCGARSATARRPRWRAGSRTAATQLLEWETDLSSQTGASQAGILLGSNENIPAFRWVEKESARLIACSDPDDCAEIERRHASGIGLRRRRHQPRQPALGRGRERADDRQPAGRGAGAEPRLPRVPREQRERDAHRRALHVGGRARADRRRAPAPPRRAAARPPRRHLSVPARRDVRLRARPRDVRGAAGHVPRRAGDLRDVRELRRGRAPLRARAARHARGAAQARPALRDARARAALRAAAVRDRRALRPRPDAGRDVPPAQRLRPRRARAALAGVREGRRRRRGRRARRAGRAGRRRGDAAGPQERKRKRRTTCRTATSSCWARATSASST